MSKFFISVAGNIGVGKSTLVSVVALKLGWTPLFEEFEDNPYLTHFYDDMRRWSFHSQVFFLTRRLRQHFRINRSDENIIQDRSIYEDAEVFARNLYNQGHMAEADWQTYKDLYETLSMILTPPDLIIYLKASVPTLLKRIDQRGREIEKSISAAYLSHLNDLYEEWVDRFSLCPVLPFATDHINFEQDNEQMNSIILTIQNRIRS